MTADARAGAPLTAAQTRRERTAQRLRDLRECLEQQTGVASLWEGSYREAIAERDTALRQRDEARAIVDDPDLIERLADLEHERWSGWMTYLFTKGHYLDTGQFVIDAESAYWWEHLIETPYADLTERSKESDRVEVRKTLALIRDALLGRLDDAAPARDSGRPDPVTRAAHAYVACLAEFTETAAGNLSDCCQEHLDGLIQAVEAWDAGRSGDAAPDEEVPA